MRITLRPILIVIVLAAVPLLSCTNPLKSRRTGPHSGLEGPHRNLILNLTPDTKQIYVGEPLVVRIAVVNPGPDTAYYMPAFGPSYGVTDYIIKHQDGQGERLQKWWPHSITAIFQPKRYPPIPPGDSLYAIRPLAFWGKGEPGLESAIFNRPGWYSVVATFRLQGRRGNIDLRSNKVTVFVHPTPEEEIAPRDLFVSLWREWFFYGAGYRSDVIREACTRIVREWPESAYAKYAFFYGARATWTEVDCDVADEEYERFLALYEPSMLSELAEIGLVACRVARNGEPASLFLDLPEEYRSNENLWGRLRKLRRQGKLEGEETD